MHSGGRNFGDFFLWREDDGERRRANEELKTAKNAVWKLLEEADVAR
jgi:hypothetical protein